jgi:hypothetical protein
LAYLHSLALSRLKSFSVSVGGSDEPTREVERVSRFYSSVVMAARNIPRSFRLRFLGDSNMLLMA